MDIINGALKTSNFKWERSDCTDKEADTELNTKDLQLISISGSTFMVELAKTGEDKLLDTTEEDAK